MCLDEKLFFQRILSRGKQGYHGPKSMNIYGFPSRDLPVLQFLHSDEDLRCVADGVKTGLPLSMKLPAKEAASS